MNIRDKLNRKVNLNPQEARELMHKMLSGKIQMQNRVYSVYIDKLIFRSENEERFTFRHGFYRNCISLNNDYGFRNYQYQQR